MTFGAAKSQVDVKVGGRGRSYLNVQLTLSEEKVNMLMAFTRYGRDTIAFCEPRLAEVNGK